MTNRYLDENGLSYFWNKIKGRLSNKEVMLRKSETHIQWKYFDDVEWTNLVAIDDLKGEDGVDGAKGEKGESGIYVGSGDMPESYNVQIDPNGDGETLQDMIDSALLEAKNSGDFKGADGVDGYTPQKGVDYYTDADKAEMVQAVLSALPVYGGETA
jgi:hypothetical protein